jgi:hypothetical protein
MKKQQLYTIIIMLVSIYSFAQSDSTKNYKNTITIEPGIGISPMPIMDMTLSNIVQWGINKRLKVVSYTSLKENNLFLRNFNYIKGSNNHTITQKFGVGTSFYTKRSEHTFSLLGGVKYDTYRETLDNPKYDKITVSVQSWSPDTGILYNLKLGKKKYFFSYRMYIPLSPYPLITRDLSASDGNISNVSLEAGLGIRLN